MIVPAKNWLSVKTISSRCSCFAQTLLIFSHLSSDLLAVLAKLKRTPNRTNLAAQSKYVYMTQEAIKTRKQAK